ncbi:MAG: hypothetical protein PHT76_15050 [Anaerostipes sp.]|nr:hypothetical protein [Anaerostipes sp.]
MLTYKRICQKNNELTYEFYPDGNLKAPGVVVFYLDGTKEILKDSEDDVKGYYSGHALNGIDITKENGTVAWC